MINHGRQNLNQTFNINIHSTSSYIIRDLVPGYDYSVELVPRTSFGVLTPSYTYRVKPTFSGKFRRLFNRYWITNSHIIIL